jgi:3'-5' exoribonuclease 1
MNETINHSASRLALPPYLLIIDLEATCDDVATTIPRHQREIIEIGAVLVRTSDLVVESEWQTFVRPIVFPRLTAFCTKLTSIQQADVDAAPKFPEAIAGLRDFIGGRPALFGSWGDYDRAQLDLDAARHAVDLPFHHGHLNVKWLFSTTVDRRSVGVTRALRRVGLEFEGTLHRGIDDARNIARLLPWALGRKKVAS